MVGFVNADLHRVCAAGSGLTHGCFHEGAAESVATLRGRDVELCEVALETAAPDCVAEAEYGESVGTTADEQDDGVTSVEQVHDALLQRFN